MKIVTARRSFLRASALIMTTSVIGVASAVQSSIAADGATMMPHGATHLDALMKRLAQAPRRRDFKTVPMILDHPEQWDYEALNEVLAYGAVQKQAWDNTDLGGPWLNLMRNALNSQIWSFKHQDFLAVSVTHGTAQLALFDQAMWDKYRLTKLAGENFATNTLIIERKLTASDPTNYEDPAGPFSGEDNSIPALMRRGVVFMSCHNAIWELSERLTGLCQGNLVHRPAYPWFPTQRMQLKRRLFVAVAATASPRASCVHSRGE